MFVLELRVELSRRTSSECGQGPELRPQDQKTKNKLCILEIWFFTQLIVIY